MGAAWCRERAAHAHHSKSPLDRVIVSCVDKVYAQPKTSTGPVIPLEGDHRQRTYNVTSSPLPAVHTHRRLNGSSAVGGSGWQSADLEVPHHQETTSDDCESIGPTPVPPPRKKRRTRTSAATSGAAARVAAAQAEAKEASQTVSGQATRTQQRSVSTVIPPTIRTDDSEVRIQKLSTISLPDYQKLDKAKHGKSDKNHLRPHASSAGGSSVSSISEATVERLDEYMRRCRSFGSVNTGQLVEQLVAKSGSHTPTNSSASSSDEESDDSWGMGDLDNPIVPGEGPPLSPTHRLSGKRRKVGVSMPRGSLPSDDPAWFHRNHEPRDVTDSPAAFFLENGKAPEEVSDESNLREVRKELQSIVYDFNLYGGKDCKSRTDLEILPTKPITQERKKKISIKSITPPPSPELTDHEEEPIRNGEDNTHSEMVSKILNGYEKVIASAATLQGQEVQAEAVLRELGVPISLSEGSPASHSRRSSMTPSLSELEAAISDLLEQTQAADGDDDDGAAADNRINNMLEKGDKNMSGADTTVKPNNAATTPSSEKTTAYGNQKPLSENASSASALKSVSITSTVNGVEMKNRIGKSEELTSAKSDINGFLTLSQTTANVGDTNNSSVNKQNPSASTVTDAS